MSGSTVTITGAGSCTITASQAGNVNYNPATNVPRTFNITSGGGGASPDGTTVPPATQIIDNAAATWTIGANQVILRNGVQAAGGPGSKILWFSANDLRAWAMTATGGSGQVRAGLTSEPFSPAAAVEAP